MADFEKVWSIKVTATDAIKDLALLDRKLLDVNKVTKLTNTNFLKLNKSLEKTSKNSQKLRDGLSSLGKKLDETDKDLKQIDSSALKAGKSLDRQIGKRGAAAVRKLAVQTKKAKFDIDKLRGGLDKASRRLSIMAIGMAGLGAVSVRNTLKINEGMANVSTLLNNGGKEVFKLKKEVQDMAIVTGQSTEDLSDGLYEVVSALGDTTEKMDQLKIASDAAIAGKSSTLESIKLLSAVTKGYGDTSAQAMTRVSDLAFMTVKLGQTTFPELAASMGRVIPTAAALNVSQEELFASFATMTGVTGNAAEVSTQLSSVLRAMLKPTDDMKKAVKDLGFKSAAAMVKQIGMAKSLELLGKHVKGSETKLAKLFNRAEGMTAVFSLLGKNADNFNEKLGIFNSDQVSGQTAEAYRRQTEGINAQGHAFRQAQRRVEVFSQRIGDRLIPVLAKLLDRIEPLIKYIENMSDETIDGWIALGKWVAIMAIATKGLSSFLGVVQSLGSLSTMIQGIDTAAGGMANLATQSSSALGFLSKLGLVGAAGAAGVALGSALNEIVLEPLAKERYRKTGEAEETGFLASQTAKTGDRAKIEKDLAAVRAAENEFKRTAGQASVWDLAGGLASAVGLADESPAQKRARTSASLKKGRADLEAALEAADVGDWLAGGAASPLRVTQAKKQQKIMSSLPGVGRGGTTVNTGAVNIKIDGAKNPKATGKEVKKVLKALGKDVDRVQASVGASEQ
jgi:TP901 family phage tail tape measure protein